MDNPTSMNGIASANAQTAAPFSPASNGEGRAANGQFAKGNTLGKGNPFYRRLAEVRAHSIAEISPSEVRAIMRKLLDLGMAGDVAAISILLRYVIGKPAKAVNPDNADLNEWRKLESAPPRVEVDVACLDVVPTPVAIEALHEAKMKLHPFDPRMNPGGAEILQERAARRKQRRRR
jgi:hypothetical protein